MTASSRTKWQRWMALVLACCLQGTGCAPAYRCYRGCPVDCRYCPPPPLPYYEYNTCACHSHPAQKYLTGFKAPARSTGQVEPEEGD